MNFALLRKECAERLAAARDQPADLTAFVGLDGFVDDIVKVVDKRHDAESYNEITTISLLSERIAGAVGKSTNIEMVKVRTKLGGNGPIMANALAKLGLKVDYLGALGYPNVNPVFGPLSNKANVHSICEPGYTNALEFEDGKIMFTRTVELNDVNWATINERYGADAFTERIATSNLVSFVNWTMIPYMSDLWDSILAEICPKMEGPRRLVFFDLADPEKRSDKDVKRALELIRKFSEYFDVVLGLNEKEAVAIGRVMNLPTDELVQESLSSLACAIYARLDVDNLVVHPVAFALAVDQDGAESVDGPYIPRPVITTGAGDHFNAGYCLGRLLGFDKRLCLMTGVTTSGYYVKTGETPTIDNLVELLEDWPLQSVAISQNS
jgi:sugar/nucleoside kinase (ribokinase family)